MIKTTKFCLVSLQMLLIFNMNSFKVLLFIFKSYKNIIFFKCQVSNLCPLIFHLIKTWITFAVYFSTDKTDILWKITNKIESFIVTKGFVLWVCYTNLEFLSCFLQLKSKLQSSQFRLNRNWAELNLKFYWVMKAELWLT